ncbi:hypothetical protein QOZ80_5AG0392570 [Eleusine coracana subsp. coracana]|nr:hypothetical protein QOZ80_5AG0392570 [Eleusine coracana subsp. coracana]
MAAIGPSASPPGLPTPIAPHVAGLPGGGALPGRAAPACAHPGEAPLARAPPGEASARSTPPIAGAEDPGAFLRPGSELRPASEQLKIGFSSSLPRQMKWLPKEMDPNSGCRVVIKVPAYVELPCEDYHVTENLKFVVDKDTVNWIDFVADLKSKIKHGKEQELHVYFLDKSSQEKVEITSDSDLLNAFSQYWDIRRLTLEAIVHDIDELDNAIVPCTSSVVETTPTKEQPRTITTTMIDEEVQEEQVDELELLGPNYEPEYVGMDDEGMYLSGNDDDNVAAQTYVAPNDVAIVPNVVIEKEDGCRREEEDIDDADWEGTEDDNIVIPIAMHDKKNPVMKVDTKFCNIHDFRLAICQYAIKKEFEFNLDKSEPGRFRAHCVAEGCKWYIYTKAMMDKTTFQVQRHRVKHTCASTMMLSLVVT